MGPEEGSQYSDRYARAIEKFLASPETNIEFSKEIYWQLKSEFSDRQKGMSRWAFYTVVLICIFELLNRRLIGGASLLGIQVDRLGFLAYFLPPAVAFCITTLFAQAIEQLSYGYLMAALAEQELPGLFVSQMNLLFTSTSGLLSSDVPDAFATRFGKFNNSLLFGMQAGFIFVGWLIFEIYAYVELFRHTNHFNAATFASLLVTISFIIMIVLRLIEVVSDPAISSRVPTKR